MKNRKTLIVAVILVAVLCIGVGFATVNDTLKVEGSATVAANETEFDNQISFKSAEATTAPAKDTAVLSENNDTVTINCTSLVKKGDSATFTFVAQNTGDLNAAVAVVLSEIANNEGYFSVEHTAGANFDLNASGEKEFTVTITLLQTPAKEKTATFTLSLTAEAN